MASVIFDCKKKTVRVNNSLSKYIYVLSGVPQCYHLGPLPFSRNNFIVVNYMLGGH